MLEEPCYCLPDTVLEHGLRFPANLRLDLIRSNGITSVVTLSVLNIGNQILADKRFSRVSFRQHVLKCLNNYINNLNIPLFVVTANVVGLKESALLLNHINSLGMILNVEPVSDIESVTVDRKLLALKSIVDNKRNQLLRELIRSVVIAAVCNICRELICVHIGLNQHI